MTALIHCGDALENQQRVLPLALDLKRQGLRPLVMTYRENGVLFRRHGIEAVPLEGGQGTGHRARVVRALARGLPTDLSVDADWILDFEAQRTGRQPRRWRLIDRLLLIDTLLKQHRPTRVYIWNGYNMIGHVLRQLCPSRHIDTYFLERGPFEGSVFVDPEGVGGRSQLHRLALEDLATGQPLPLPIPPPPTVGRAELCARLGINARRLIFVPLQVERDTNILLDGNGVKSMREFVSAVCDATSGTGTVVLVRPHPEEAPGDLALPVRSNLIVCREGSVEDLCDAADVVVTINSTVGLTAVLRGRPVVALGRAIYTNKGLCVETSPAGLRAVLQETPAPAPPARLLQFYRALVTHYLRTAEPNPPADSSVARSWERALEQTRRVSRGRTTVPVYAALSPRDRLNLSYRRARERIQPELLRAGLADLLEVPPSRIELLSKRQRDAALVVITTQERSPAISRDTLLVLDPTLEPHLSWLLHNEGEQP